MSDVIDTTAPCNGLVTSSPPPRSNDFGADITLATGWTKFTIKFANTTQQSGWGAPRPAKIDPTTTSGSTT